MPRRNFVDPQLERYRRAAERADKARVNIELAIRELDPVHDGDHPLQVALRLTLKHLSEKADRAVDALIAAGHPEQRA